MIKAFLNILEAAFIKKNPAPGYLPGPDEIIYEGYLPGKDVPKTWSCLLLDTADRAAALLGEPARKLYLSIAEWHEYLWRSIKDEVVPVYRERYVNKTISGWNTLNGVMNEKLGTTNPGENPYNFGDVPFQGDAPVIPLEV
jgi:hypothetical protein